MFLRMLMGVLALTILISQAFANPGKRVPLERFFNAVSKTSGQSYEHVEREGYRAIRSAKEFSKKDLEILATEGASNPALERRMVRFLQEDKSFLVNTGIAQIRNERLAQSLSIEMDTYAFADSAVALKRAATAVEIQMIRREALLATFKAQLANLELLRRDPNVATNPDFVKLNREKLATSAELEAAGDDYVRSMLNLLSELGIPYQESPDGTGLSAVIPYKKSSAKLFKALKADPRFADMMSQKPTLRVSYPSADGTVIMSPSSKIIYVGLDVVSRLF